MGQSFFYKEPVSEIIGPRLAWTLILIGTSLFITLLIGIPLGVQAARHKGRWLDQTVSTLIVLGISIFIPLLAFILVYVFSLQLGLTPVGGAFTPDVEDSEWLGDVLRHMVLPTATLVVVNLAQIVLYTRSSMLDVLKAGLHPHGARQGHRRRPRCHVGTRPRQRDDPDGDRHRPHARQDGRRRGADRKTSSPGRASAR